jgi:RNA polymerase sigma-70 factor (ECF subfamily)
MPVQGALSSDSADGEDHRTEDRPIYSFKELCLPYYGVLVNFARRLCGDAALANDVVQEALCNAVAAWPRFEPRGDDAAHAVRAWLYSIVWNTHTKVYHRQRVLQKAEKDRFSDVLRAAHGAADGAAYDLRDMIDSPFGDEVTKAVAALSEDHRSVIELYYVQRLTCDEISRLLRIPMNTVFTRLNRAREALERALRTYAAERYNLRRARVDTGETIERPET